MSATFTRSRRQSVPQADAFLASLAAPGIAAILDANIATGMLLAGPAAFGDADPLVLLDGAIDALQRARAALAGS